MSDILKRLEQAEAATRAALNTAPWSKDKDACMLLDRNHSPLLRHIARSCAWAWSSDFDPVIAPEVISYFVAMNPAAMMPLLQVLREFMATQSTASPEGPFMTAADRESIYRKALAAWGADTQINQCMEEFGEATAALNRYRRGRGTDLEAAEEVADAAIMVDQMTILFGADLVGAIKQQKLERLQHALNCHSVASHA